MVIHSVDSFPNYMSMLTSVMLGDNLEVGQNFCFLLMAEKLIATTILLNVCSPDAHLYRCVQRFPSHPQLLLVGGAKYTPPPTPSLIRTKITESNRVKSILWSVALIAH